MKIVIPGGSGQVGTLLARAFHDGGHDVVVLSRRPIARPWRVVAWDGVAVGPWLNEVDGCDVVINLAGRSVNCRYNRINRKEILDSRVLSTRAIGRAISQSIDPPRLWLQASTATIYAHRYDQPNDERTGQIGGTEAGVPETWRFSIDVALAWEHEFNEAAAARTRKIALRAAVVMSPQRGGPFDMLLALVRRGLGGPAGDGRQFVSWIHDVDFVEAVRWLMAHDDVDGVVNIASPSPLPNAEFMQALRGVAGVSVGLAASRWMLEIGARVMKTETELILKSRRVVPGRLLEHGFTFTHPHWPAAAVDLYRRWSSVSTPQATARSRRRGV
jgi:uncharacterized protein